MKYSKVLSVLFFLASLAVFVGFLFFYDNQGDTVPPVIRVSDEAFTCSISATEEELLEGITASDDQDGDLSDQIFVESLGNFIDENTRILNVAVLDKAGNTAKGKRVLVYEDYSAPKFTLTKPLKFSVGTREITEFIQVNDMIDGDLSAKVKTCSPYHLSYEAGDYPMEFMVSNSAGDVSRFNATVTLLDNRAQDHNAEIELSDYLVYTEKGKKISPWSYVKKLTMNGHEYQKADKDLLPVEESNYNWTDYPAIISKSDFKIDDSTDYDQEGCYEIEYTYTNGDYKDSVRLVVIVE